VEDGGTGKNADHLRALGSAYDAVSAFLAAEGVDDVYAAVMPELNKLFTAANKDIINVNGNPIPTPLSPNASFGDAHGNLGGAPDRLSGQALGDGILKETPGVPSAENADGAVKPSGFRRGYLNAGHARETGAGQSASPARPANVGSGGAPKTHGALDAPHQRNSPGDAKRAGMSLVTQLHDALVIAFPNVSCCLDPRDPAEAPKVAPSTVFGGTESPLLGGISKRAKKKAVKKAAKKAARKAAKKARKEAKESIATTTAAPGTKLTKLATPGDQDKLIKKLKKRAKKEAKRAKAIKRKLKSARATARKADAPGFQGGNQQEPTGTDQEEHGQAAAAAQTDLPVGTKPGAAGEKKPKKNKGKKSKVIKGLKKRLKKIESATDPNAGAVRREPLHKGVDAEAQKRKDAEVTKAANERKARLENQAVHAADPAARDRAQQELMKMESAATAA